MNKSKKVQCPECGAWMHVTDDPCFCPECNRAERVHAVLAKARLSGIGGNDR